MSQYIPSEQLAAIKETTKRIDRYMRNLNRRPISAGDIAQVSMWLDQINGLCSEVDEQLRDWYYESIEEYPDE